MTIIKCFMCSCTFEVTEKSFDSDKISIKNHLQSTHNFKKQDSYTITCGFENCNITFSYLKSYFKHLYKKHLCLKPTIKNDFHFSPINFDAKFVRLLAELRATSPSSCTTDIYRFISLASELVNDCMKDVVSKTKNFLWQRILILKKKTRRDF